jgi:UDP-N-acetylglucosamine 4,6-dehydratase/5-epimerase
MKILITGGAGSVGKFLTERFYEKHELLIFDKDDYLLWDLTKRFPKAKYVLGDVRNSVDISMPVKWADLVIHAAAYKNIEVTELNPLATCDNDFYGTVSVVHELQKYSGKKFILTSTDKAVYPLSALGASKMLAEKFVLEVSEATEDNTFAIARFVNVVETRGNVFEAWREQEQQQRPFELTDKRMERHFNTIANVQDFFEEIIVDLGNGAILIPDVPKRKVIDVLFELYGADCEYIEIGTRLNERLYDPLYTGEEAPFVEKLGGYLKIDYRRVKASFQQKHQAARQNAGEGSVTRPHVRRATGAR